MTTTKQLTGSEKLANCPPQLAGATVHHFWQWAFSDLQRNDTRSAYAEWLVAQLLDIPLTTRVSLTECDLRTPAGVTILVKSSAYLQSPDQRDLSKINFSGLNVRKFNPDTNEYAENPTFNADLYVFCVQTQTDPGRWNALELNQWDFYLLPKAELEKLGQKTMSLSHLSTLCNKMNAREFRAVAKVEIDKI